MNLGIRKRGDEEEKMLLRIRNREKQGTRRGSTGMKIKIRRKSRRIVGNLRKEKKIHPAEENMLCTPTP